MSSYERVVDLMLQVQEEAYYRGVKGQPVPTREQANQAAWKFVALAAKETISG